MTGSAGHVAAQERAGPWAVPVDQGGAPVHWVHSGPWPGSGERTAAAPWLRGCSSPWRYCEGWAGYVRCGEADARVSEDQKRPGRRVGAVGRLGGGSTTSTRPYTRNDGRERAGGGPADSSPCSEPHGGLLLGRDAASAEIDGGGSNLCDDG